MLPDSIPDPIRDEDRILMREYERILALKKYEILDTPPEGAYDNITALVAKLLKVPICIVSLVDEDRIWFKSHHGLDSQEIERSPGLCSSVIMQDDLYLVEDALLDPRTLTNSLVTSDFGLRFYAGYPLKTSSNHNLGSFCVVDKNPRTLTEEESQLLKTFADIIINQLELRLSARELVASLAKAKQEAYKIEKLEQIITVCAWSKQIFYKKEWVSMEVFLQEHLGLQVSHGISEEAAQKAMAELGLNQGALT